MGSSKKYFRVLASWRLCVFFFRLNSGFTGASGSSHNLSLRDRKTGMFPTTNRQPSIVIRQLKWWRRGESNPRPKVFNSRVYMLTRFHKFIRQETGTGKLPAGRPSLEFLSGSPEGGRTFEDSANVTPCPVPRKKRGGRLRLFTQLRLTDCWHLIVFTMYLRGTVTPRHASTASITPVEPITPP